MKNTIFWTFSEINGYTFWLKSKRKTSANNINFLPPVGKDLIEFETELFNEKIDHVIGLLLMDPNFNKTGFELVKFEE